MSTQLGQQLLHDKQNTVRALACDAAAPPDFALAVLDQESGFGNNMRGSLGEIGASQILPSTAVALALDLQRLARAFSWPRLGPRLQSQVQSYVASVEQLMQTRYAGVSCQ